MLNALVTQLSTEKLFDVEIYPTQEHNTICCEMATDKNYIAFIAVYPTGVDPDITTLFKDVANGVTKIISVVIEALE